MWDILLVIGNALAFWPFHRYWPEAHKEIQVGIKYMRDYYYNTLWELSPYSDKEWDFSSLVRQAPSLLNIIRDYPIILRFQKTLAIGRLLILGIAFVISGTVIVTFFQPFISIIETMAVPILVARTFGFLILVFQSYVLFRITLIKKQATDFKDQYEIELKP